MPTYAYKAKDRAGQTVSGTLDAETQVSAADHVRRMGLVPLGLTEVGRRATAQADSRPRNGLAARLVYPIWTGVSVKSQMLFFRQLATMLQAGMVLSGALANLVKQAPCGKLRRVAREAQLRVEAGGRLSEVLERHPWIFTPVQVGLIRAGENSGAMDAMIDRIAGYLEQEMDIRRMIRAGTLYPKLLVVAALLIIRLPALVLSGGKAYLDAEMALVVPVLKWAVPIYLILRLLLQFEGVRAAYDTIKVTIPVIGMLVRKLAVSRFSRALALLYSSGTPMAQAVQISADAVGNFLVRRSVSRAVPLIANGVPASEAFRRTGQMPPMVLDMLATGEKTGNVDLTINKVAEYYEKEAESTVKTLSIVLSIVLLLAVALVIAMYVINSWAAIGARETNPGI